nr:growth/differentiation factor 15-like [Loxodonta africana]
MSQLGPTPLYPLPAMPLLMLLLSLLPPPGDTLSPVQEGSPDLSGPDLDSSRVREMQKRYKDLVDRLRVNQSWEDSNADHRTATVVWILTPKRRTWVLPPPELDVRACVGACPAPLPTGNTHARMKARLHDLDPGSVPEPCCVPASFEPVVLMHQDSDGRVTLTSYDDILVKDCHCA